MAIYNKDKSASPRGFIYTPKGEDPTSRRWIYQVILLISGACLVVMLLPSRSELSLDGIVTASEIQAALSNNSLSFDQINLPEKNLFGQYFMLIGSAVYAMLAALELYLAKRLIIQAKITLFVIASMTIVLCVISPIGVLLSNIDEPAVDEYLLEEIFQARVKDGEAVTPYFTFDYTSEISENSDGSLSVKIAVPDEIFEHRELFAKEKPEFKLTTSESESE